MVYVQVRQWGAWKLYPYNSFTQKLFLIAQFGTSFGFEVMRVAFWFLVISTVSTMSTVSSQASKHFFQFCSLPTPYYMSRSYSLTSITPHALTLLGHKVSIRSYNVWRFFPLHSFLGGDQVDITSGSLSAHECSST